MTGDREVFGPPKSLKHPAVLDEIHCEAIMG
jgi:hypothetical protein